MKPFRITAHRLTTLTMTLGATVPTGECGTRYYLFFILKLSIFGRRGVAYILRQTIRGQTDLVVVSECGFFAIQIKLLTLGQYLLHGSNVAVVVGVNRRNTQLRRHTLGKNVSSLYLPPQHALRMRPLNFHRGVC